MVKVNPTCGVPQAEPVGRRQREGNGPDLSRRPGDPRGEGETAMASDRIMEQIEHVVLLMLENRSLDNVLGWLYETGRPARVVPEGSPAEFNGVAGHDLFNDYQGPKPIGRGSCRVRAAQDV